MGVSRQRQQKKRSDRTPAVWRGAMPSAASPAERPVVEHGVRNQMGISWRAVSGLIVVVLVVLLVVFFATDIFYVRNVIVSGANYLEEGEVFRYADIAEMHIFWVDPSEVRQNILEASPVVADARVVVGWPPDMVKIYIEEREPALVWAQSGVFALVDVQGRVLRYPPEGESRPDLLQVIADNTMEGPPGLDAPIPLDAITGALQLQNLLSGLPSLRYNETKGLGFRDTGGWDVWLGTGTDMPNKLLIYEALSNNLASRGITPIEINVATPGAAYYCGSIEECYG